MVMSLPLLGLGFNLDKTSFDSKKRTLENLGFSVSGLRFNYENMEIVDKLYKVNRLKFVDSYMDSEAQIDAWLSGEDNKCTDGCDDGHISIFSKVWNFVEGQAKTVVGCVRSLFNDPVKLFKFVGTAALMAAIAITGPVGVAVVSIIGIVGACGLINNGIKDFKNAVEISNNATSDAEAKAAFEQMGSGTLQVGVGIVCAKQASGALFTEYQPVVFEDAFCSNLEDISVLVDKS